MCYDIEVKGGGEELRPVRLGTLYRALRVSRGAFCSAARGISIRLPKGSHVRRTDAQTALRRRMAVRGGHRAERSECLAAVIPVEPCPVRTQGVLRKLRCSDKAADLASASGRRTRRGASYASIWGTPVLDAQQLPGLPAVRVGAVLAIVGNHIARFACLCVPVQGASGIRAGVPRR